MLKKTSLFIAGAALCFSSWADITGTYQCSKKHHDTLETGEVTITKTGKTYSYDMKWQGRKSTKGKLKPTSSDTRFLTSWEGNHHVGVSEWVFGKDSFKEEYVSHHSKMLGLHKGVVDCVIKK
jgi:hypothetical protein